MLFAVMFSQGIGSYTVIDLVLMVQMDMFAASGNRQNSPLIGIWLIGTPGLNLPSST